ncbi:thiamine diphosphokinase [Thioclava sp. FR2]|uniref:thiamine diphosphokinase n=1 Tax=Thioclava sp. FR2 TaxID=3445780 RepID=UPI003EB91BBE
MNQPIVESSGGITLVGGGPVSAGLFRIAVQRAPVIVAADSGADRCVKLGAEPAAVIGDMDSISPAVRATLGARVHPIAEQDSTDFDKALRSVKARFVLAVGFVGARADHELAAFNVLVRRTETCLMLGPEDVVFHLPPRFEVDLPVGERFSLFPMRPLTGTSDGLEWAIDGLELSPAGRTSTSNRVSKRRVRVEVSGPGMLAILPRKHLDRALQALLASSSD